MTARLRNLELSSLTRRRLRNFRANRRGWWSLWIFAALLVITMPAEFVANDKPLLVEYKDHFYYPVFVDYPESTFGGFLAQTDYRDPFIIKEINAHGWMIWPPIRYSYNTVNFEQPLPAPSPAKALYVLGCSVIWDNSL